MNKMIKRILAAILVTSMLLGSNGISYAAETAAGDGIAGTEEVSQESEAGEQMESPGDSEESGPAYEESAATDTEEQAQEEAGDEGQEADAQSVEETGAEASGENDAAIAEDGSSEEEAADAEASEDTEVAAAELTAEEAAAAAQAQEEVFTAGELVYHGGDYDVTLAYDEAAKIPATAELKVREITKGTSEYESYLAGAEAAAGKGVAEARFFDITIWAAGTDGQQQEIQPQSPVRVSITYHSAIEVADEGEVQAMHFENGTSDAEVVSSDTNGGSEVSEIAFDADSFSVYGIIYTVDFTYGGYTFSMPGEGSIYLSELAEILGLYETDLDKAFSVGNVSDVSFTDYDLVKIEKQADGDWLLISLAPFTSEETLTIEMNDGVTFIVDVTDDVSESSDLTNFVKNVIISGATQNSDGSYNVEKGKDYSITIAFTESSVYQFENDATLTYAIPQGITVLNEQSGPMTINIMAGGRTYQVGASYNLDTDGNLEIKFNPDDPYYSKLVSSTNVSFRFEYYAEFDGSSNKIKFSEEVERDIVFEEEKPGQAFVSKTATYDEDTGRFNYTIKITADGDVQNVNVKDTISGNALRFNRDVAITGKSEDHYTGSVTNNGFEYTFDSMSEGDVITITYSANVDFSMDGDKDGKITADQTSNTVTVTPEDGEPHSSNYSHEITF